MANRRGGSGARSRRARRDLARASGSAAAARGRRARIARRPRTRRALAAAAVCGPRLAAAACLVDRAAGLDVGAAQDPVRAPTPPQSGPGCRRRFVYGFACLTLLSQACARLGAFRGDAFAAGLLAWVLAILGLFVAYPLVKLGVSAFQSPRGAFAPEMFWHRVSDVRIWRADGPLRTTILLGFASATSSTVLALAFGS